MLVGELLAHGSLEPPADGTPIIMANGEPGIYRAAKRPFRNDRRRRRGGFRFTPKTAQELAAQQPDDDAAVHFVDAYAAFASMPLRRAGADTEARGDLPEPHSCGP
jgi:hypothetical protein